MNGGGEYGKATMVLLCRAIDECDPPMKVNRYSCHLG